MSFKILSIDGGGVRGTYPAAYLNYIQEKIEEPIYKYFDLIVGTSTGGIIALALSHDVPIQTILDFYINRSKEIFSRKTLRFLNRGLILPKYSNKILVYYLKEIFKDSILGEAKTRVCIPSVDLTNGKPIVFKTPHHTDYVNDHKIENWVIAASTSAAPIYYPAFVNNNDCHFVDGGLWANNPSQLGIFEAIKLGYQLDQIKLLSIGTCSKDYHRDSKFFNSLGVVGWRTELIDISFQCQSEATHYGTTYLLKKENYLRIDRKLPSDRKFFSKFGLDKPKSINSLRNFGEYKAKETFKIVNESFFSQKSNTYSPIKF